ncbi:MAG: Rdx family protein [Chloroflexota bacterium]|nr:Rdx family protein [Chloroflexota bacterium]
MPQAASLAASIRERFGVDPEVSPGAVGIFDVAVDGEVIYSKYETGRFPSHDEVIEKLMKR